MAVSIKDIQPILFSFMMLQLVVIAILQPFRNTIIGNIIFWEGLIIGLPLIFSLYVKFTHWLLLYYITHYYTINIYSFTYYTLLSSILLLITDPTAEKQH